MMRRLKASKVRSGGTAVVLISTALMIVGGAQAALSEEAGGSSVSIQQGGQSLRAGDGCAEVEQGGRVVRAGDCDGGTERSGPGDGPRRPEGTDESTLPETTVREETVREPSDPETTGTIPETTVGQDEAVGGCPAGPEGETVEVTVERAVDGDTVELARPVRGETLVRLIGVDAPELEGKGSPEPGAADAADFTASELEDARVLLEFDRDETDSYGRLLAYLWRGPELFNLALLEGSHAEATTVEPNDRYVDCFEEAESTPDEEDDAPPNGITGQYDEETGAGTTRPEPGPPGTTTPEQTLPEETIWEGSTGGDEPTASPPTTSPPERAPYEGRREPEPPAPEAPSDQYGDADEWTVPEDDADTGAAQEDPAGPDPALPERQTPNGPVPVLPETGGPAALPLLGALLVALGILAAHGARDGADDPRDGR